MTRYERLEKLINDNGYKTFAEIGVRHAETSKYLSDKCGLTKLILVDKVKQFDEVKNSQFYEMTSEEASTHIDNDSIDIVFIDADHSYDSVMSDIKAWIGKVRKGGIISGHDYLNSAHRDVKRAVDEYFGEARVCFDEDCYTWWVQL